mgnify:FL=1
MNNKTISMVLSVILIIMLSICTYGWMQTMPSSGENIEYNRNFYITDSDIGVKLYTLIDNSYVEQGQLSTDPLITIENMYPGKIQRYRFELTNIKEVPSRVKIVFTELDGNINLLKSYLKINITSPYLTSFTLNDKLELNEDNNRYFFDFADSVTIPANSTLNFYFNFEIDINAPNTLQATSFEVKKIMFIKPM